MSNDTSRGERALRELRTVRVLHPMLLALIPLCGNYAYGENAELLPLSALARPAAVLVGSSIVLWLLATALRKDRHHGGLVASALIVPLIVVWGVLEEIIGTAIPMFSGLPRAVFYAALISGLAAIVATVAYRFRTDKPALMVALRFTVVAVVVSAAFATFGLAPVFGRRAAWLITAYLGGTAALVWRVWNFKGDCKLATRSLNWFSAILLLLYVAVLAVNRPESAEAAPAELPIATDRPIRKELLPDIYLIALDGYARADVLRTSYAYNNFPFEEEMKAFGFRIAARSTANYPQPVLSLTALLNADYLDNLVREPAAREQASMSQVFAYYHNNSLFKTLRGLGYRIESFSPGLESLEPRRKDVIRLEPGRALGEFEMVLIDRTFVSRVMQAYYYVRHQNPAYWRYSFRRSRIIHAFDEMARLATETNDAPRFIFANLLIPEPPYLFTRDGGRAQPYGPGSLGGDRVFRGRESEYQAAYLDQIYFTNQKLVQTSKRIVESSKRPAVIVILSSRGAPPALERQADPAKERFRNLLMVRFPPEYSEGEWRDSISLVNVFRLVLNHALDARLPLLEDKTFVSSEEKPFLVQPAEL